MQKVLTLFIRINVCMLMLMCECNSLLRFFSSTSSFRMQEASSKHIKSDEWEKKTKKSRQQQQQQQSYIWGKEPQFSCMLWMTDCVCFCVDFAFVFSYRNYFSRSQIFVRPTQKSCSCHFSQLSRAHCSARKKSTPFEQHKQTMMPAWMVTLYMQFHFMQSQRLALNNEMITVIGYVSSSLLGSQDSFHAHGKTARLNSRRAPINMQVIKECCTDAGKHITAQIEQIKRICQWTRQNNRSNNRPVGPEKTHRERERRRNDNQIKHVNIKN